MSKPTWEAAMDAVGELDKVAAAPRRELRASATRPIKPGKLAHIVIRTRSYDACCAWWSSVLGATPAYQNAQISFMTYDEEHHRIGLVNMPDLAPKDYKNCGVDHIAFTYESLEELLANYLRLKAIGIEPFWVINHGPTISMYYKDPDGNKAELQFDVFDTPDEVNAFFDSGKYEENFMGIIFDPEKMIADYEAGMPIQELVARPPLPPGLTAWDMHRP